MRYYDIHNISKGRLKGNITLHLIADPGKGFSYHSLLVDDVLENVRADQISEQIRLLARDKRKRPAVIRLVEVDYQARLDAQQKALDIAKQRKEKRLARAAAAKEEQAKEIESEDLVNLSAADEFALEAGTELPSDE